MLASEIAAARAWLKDCAWADLEPEDVDELTDDRVRVGIERHYAGGIDQFRRDQD